MPSDPDALRQTLVLLGECEDRRTRSYQRRRPAASSAHPDAPRSAVCTAASAIRVSLNGSKRFLLQEAHQSLIQSRTLVHTFDAKKVGERTAEGRAKAQEAIDLAARQVKDYHVRRRGFGMATLFTTILALALFLRIRQMEAR